MKEIKFNTFNNKQIKKCRLIYDLTTISWQKWFDRKLRAMIDMES